MAQLLHEPFAPTLGGQGLSLPIPETSPAGRLNRHPSKVRQAVIMAGGKGTRLHPYSATLPKPLMPIGDITILELLLRQLEKIGVSDVILSVNHLGHLIRAYFGNGSQFGMRIEYTSEDRPLGTAGSLGSVLDDLDENFFVSNGDLLTTLHLEKMVENHISKRSDATIGAFKRTVKIDFGVIEVDDQSGMIAYREKPQSEHLVSMGIYVLRREAVQSHIRFNEYLDMPELLLRMKGAKSEVRCYQEECIWLDVGRPDDFALAQNMYRDDPKLFLGD